MTAEAQRIELEVTRSVAVPVAILEQVIGNPADYPRWIEPLNSFEPRRDGTFVADVHYFGRRKQRRMRQTLASPRAFAWESIDEGSYLRWETAVSPETTTRTLVIFRWEKHGSGSVFGVSANNPLFRAALTVVTDHSIRRLQELALATR